MSGYYHRKHGNEYGHVPELQTAKSILIVLRLQNENGFVRNDRCVRDRVQEGR